MIKLSIFILIVNIVLASAVKKCCEEGDNELQGPLHKCANGKLRVDMDCESFFLPVNDSGLTIEIDKNDTMIINDNDVMASHQYCYTKLIDEISGEKEEMYLVCITEDEMDKYPALRIILMFLQFLTVIFSFFTIVIYLMVPEMLDLQGICTINSILGLMIAYIVLISENISVSYDSIKCHIVAYSIYISFLYSFFWLNLCCFNMWRLVVKPKMLNSVNNWKFIYYIYGIGGPFILFAFLATVHHWNPPILRSIHPGINEGRCWFKSMRESLIYLYAPITILLLLNIALFIMTCYFLWNQTKACKNTSVMKYRVRLYLTLFFIMGIQWVFEVLSAASEYLNSPQRLLWFIPDSLNASVGIIIFIVMVVLRKKVVRGLANRTFLGTFIRFPSRWRNLQDSECDEVEEEDINLDAVID